MKNIFLAFLFALTLFGGAGSLISFVPVALAAEDAGGTTDTSTSGGGPTSNNDCTGGQCGAETTQVDDCSASGTQCYSIQYCTEYNTPRFSSPLRVTAEAGQPFRYEVMVAQVNPNPSRDLAPWEHPQLREKDPYEAGWFGAGITSADTTGLSGSGLSANASSVTVQAQKGVPQVPDSTGLIISGTPTTPGTYSVALTSRNDLEEWIYEGGGGDNQSSTYAGDGSSRYYMGRSPSCSRADVLQIEVQGCSAGAAVITSPDTLRGKVGEAFSFRATATNHTSLSMSADRLPAGIHWDAALSMSGIPTEAGIYTFSIHASGCGAPASKTVTLEVEPRDECVAVNPTITSAGSVAAIIGGSFPGYTIQTSRPAERYSIEPSPGEGSFPASLGVTNGGRSLEGSVASAQPSQQYRFRATASKGLPNGISCSSTRDVTIGFSCPSDRPNWNSANGQCTNLCLDQAADNYNQAGQCQYPSNIRCNDPLALNSGAAAACRYSGGGGVCTDPSAINFAQPGSCQPRTGCGAGEVGRPPSCQEIACPNCGQTKMCDVCVATNEETGACTRREMRPADEARSAPNSCGLTRSLYYCPDESSAPPPPPGEQACTLPVTVTVPARQIIQKGDQCSIAWRVSGVPASQQQFLRCAISGPDGFGVRANGSSGAVLTPAVNVQSLYRFVCRNGDAKVSNTATFTCRVNPRFEEQ